MARRPLDFSPVAPEPKAAPDADARERVYIRVNASAKLQLQDLVLARRRRGSRTNVQDLLTEALNDLFVKEGLTPIA